MTTHIETLEKAVRAQEQMEDLARLAHSVKLTVEQFGNAFHELQDYPEHLFEQLCELTNAADAVAAISLDWAQTGSAAARMRRALFFNRRICCHVGARAEHRRNE